MEQKKRKLFLLIVSGIIIILILIRIFAFNGSKETNKNTADRTRGEGLPVRYLVVQPETIYTVAKTVGTVLSNEEIEVRSEISGKVEKIYFTEGSRVKKGDPIIKVNDDELQARLLSAQYRKELAEREVERQKSLFEKKLVSEREFETSVNALNVIKAEIQLIEAQIKKTEIRAPFDGVLGLRFVSEGSYLSPATLITTLADNNTVKIDFALPEKYTNDLRVGDLINFTVQGSSKIYKGRVYVKSPNIDPTTRTFQVRALYPNFGESVRAGSFAQVEVNMRLRRGIIIPSFAVIPELKRHKVFVVHNGKAEERIIEVGTRNEERIEINAGLSQGDTLIISGILQLRPGMVVTTLKE